MNVNQITEWVQNASPGDSTIYWGIVEKIGKQETTRPPSFFIIAGPVMSTRIGPPEGEMLSRTGDSPVFSWVAGTCNEKYRLLFSRDPNFQVPQFKIPGKGQIKTPSFQVKGKQWKNKVAKEAGTVYWRILSIDPLKREVLSQIYSIETTP